MKTNAAGRALLNARYSAGLDTEALADIEGRLSRSLQGARTTGNQFSALAVCAYQFGVKELLASDLFRAHIDGRKDRLCEQWVSPYLSEGGKYVTWRDQERHLYLMFELESST